MTRVFAEHAIKSLAARACSRERIALTSCLRAVAEADHLHVANSHMGRLQASSFGERYPEVVQRLREALAATEPNYALNSQLRAHIRSADRTAAEVRGCLARAILRHGPFTDSAAALDFVATFLARAERRLDRKRAAAVAARQVGSTIAQRVSTIPGSLSVPTLA